MEPSEMTFTGPSYAPVSAIVSCLVLAAVLASPARASCTCDRAGLELVFVIDATSSMKYMIGTVAG